MSVRRDYKAPNTWRSGTNKDRSRARGNAALVGALIVIGLGGVGYHYLVQDSGTLNPTPRLATPSGSQPATTAPRGASNAPRTVPPAQPPKYDFYNSLEQQEVLIPESATAHTAPLPALPAEPAPTTVTNGPVWLQVGAFRNADDADALKAKVAFLGYRAQVETVDTADGPLHRVRLGPLQGQDARDAQTALESNAMSFLVIRGEGG